MDKQEELIIANLIYPLLKDLILPKINKVIKKFSIKNVDEKSIEANFQSYLSQRFEKFSVIDTLVFPNKQTLFKDLYEPLTLCSYNEQNKKMEIKIAGYSKEFLPKYMRVIIEDTAGMGKSTITKKIFLSAVEEGACIPILIELRQINKDNDFLKEIQNQLSPIGKPISIDLILKIINDGQFVFLFDGFDEISKKDKEFVVKDLHKFIEKANNNHFLITSRQEDSLVSFGDFRKFNVRPLVEKEAFSLIKRYDNYSFKRISKELIAQLKNNKDESLKEFLSNPFLVSLLYKSFEYKKDIPIKKSQFYRQVYDALFESHDLSKEGYLKRDKYSNLHIDDFEMVLRHIGYFTAIENKVEYEKNYILKIIEKAKKYVPDLPFKASDYLKDLLETVPLFKMDGNNIKWAHKSLQDYFAAKFIWIDAKENQKPILKKIFNDHENIRFSNILDLFYELDTKTFNETILLWLLEDFDKYSATAYTRLKNIDKKLLKTRVENTFGNQSVVVITKQEDYEVIRIGRREDASKVFLYYKKKVNELGDFDGSILYNYFENPKVIALVYKKRHYQYSPILKLLSNRIPGFAKYIPHKVHLGKLNVLEQDCAYLLNDNPKNLLNHENVFSTVNDIIPSGYTIDYDYAVKKYAQIKSIVKKAQNNDFINW